MLYKLLIIVVWVSLNQISWSQSSDDWHLEKDQEGIRVFSRHLAGSRLKELRVQCTFPGDLASLVAMLSDVERYPSIMYKTKTTRLLRQTGEDNLYYYIETELPWPVDNRDMVVHLHFAQDPQTHWLHIRVEKAVDEVPPQTHLIRVTDWVATWEVRSQPNQQLQIDYQCRVDPGGTLPTWLINLTTANGPFESFKLLRKSVQDIRYQGRRFGFLTN